MKQRCSKNGRDLESGGRGWRGISSGGRTDRGRSRRIFAAQTVSAVAEDEQGNVKGLYILHPNNIGRVGHIANASYAVDRACRGEHIGELLVKDCLKQAKANGYRVLQFNAVVASNIHAFHLYQRLGFVDLGIIPGGFLNKDGVYEDIHVMYHNLVED